MKFKKFLDFFDSATKVISLIGVIITAVLIVLIKAFDIKVSDFLEKIPFIHSLVNMDLIEAFESVDTDDIFFVELEKNLDFFMKDKDNISNIEVRVDSENQKTFKITMQDGEERFVTVSKDGDQFNFKMEVLRNLIFQKTSTGSYIGDDTDSFGREIEDDYEYCSRCSGGGSEIFLKTDLSVEGEDILEEETTTDTPTSSTSPSPTVNSTIPNTSTPTETTSTFDGGGGSSSITTQDDYQYTGEIYYEDAFGYGDTTLY